MSTSTTAEVNPNLKALTEAGVSVWLDQISRQLVAGGELARMVRQESLRGVTSNPSIFEKAILGTSDYDEEIGEMARAEATAKEIYDAIAIADVQRAADTLRTVFDESGGRDGFVSLEVAPDLARDTDGTLAAARAYWTAVGKPNVMIKIPGTPEGVGAIEEAIHDGINVNVTLLFAVEAYDEIAHAYIRGLERRHAEGKSLDVNSVASFFVSRVDSNVDKKLGDEHPDLHGTAALANARAAYIRFKEIFGGERFETLAAAGAAVQRPLWASTGVKNPAYPDTMYVDGLIAPDTVNTMPLATLTAVADHGTVPGPTAEQDPAAELRALADAGIDMTQVTDELLTDGIKQFEDAMNGLLAGIEERRSAVVTGRPPTIEASLAPELEEPEHERVERAMSDNVVQRIWRRDPSLWGGPGVLEIEDRLGWLTISDPMLEQVPELTAFARELREEGYTDAVLLGMGGSSLGPEVIRLSFGPLAEGLRLTVLDSTHPDVVRQVQASVDVSKTIFVVSSKSGGTIETLSHYKHFKTLAGPEQFVVVTDPGSPLQQLAERDGLRRVFANPPDIGGRYSVLSYFGLVPAALMGVKVEELLRGSQIAEQSCTHHDAAQENVGLWLGATLGELANHGRDKLTFVVSDPIGSFGLWVEQLVAESTGKQGKGILPVAGEPLGPPEVYGDDRVFVYLRNDEAPNEAHEAAVERLTEAGQPTMTLSAHGAGDLGRLFFMAEFATAVSGWALGINPFDQPNVQEAKDNTKRVLDSGSVPELPAADDAALRALLADATPPHYVAILGYLPPSGELDAAIDELRIAIRAATGAATTFGYGPRFQHSTGQLHKGGPPTGRFLQLIDTPTASVPIPGESYDFGTLIASQAAGDLQTLRSHGLPAERVALAGSDRAAAVRQLTARITGLLKES
jgi:transaldolase/glucose-6-phosphate isomerase